MMRFSWLLALLASSSLAAKPEDVARDFARKHHPQPSLLTVRTGLAGEYFRFTQHELIDGELLRVWHGELTVLVRDGEVKASHLRLKDRAHTAKGGEWNEAAARDRAQTLLDGAEPSALERVVYVADTGTAHVAWAVWANDAAGAHEWVLLLDTATLAELYREDLVKRADGTGFVFDMNPVASTGDTSLPDSSDQATVALNAARFSVTLTNMDNSGFLRGDYADVRTNNAGQRAQSDSHVFEYARDDLGFEQTNVYFHLTRAQLHLQSLGFTNVNNRVQVAIINATNADNSFYSPGSKNLSFGLGGVDDAEDADIVLHEYGHSIHDDQVPGWGGSNAANSMGEGFGDYLAASFGEILPELDGHAQLANHACVGDWDAISYSNQTPPCLRRVDGNRHYPEGRDQSNEVHRNGEIWSGALWALRAKLGPGVVDRVLVESHFLLGPGISWFDAAQALMTVDAQAYSGANETVLRRGLIDRGLLRTLSAPFDGVVISTQPVSVEPPRVNGNYVSNEDDVQVVSVPGAQGLRLHFEQIELETHSSCLNNGCDNLYLLNGEGDLFQVISGSHPTGFTSVAVPGDTVQVRLVSDYASNRFGYRVDLVEVLGAVVEDAGVTPDAGEDAGIDAGFDGGVTPDAGIDAGFDGGVTPDAGIDAGFDGGVTPDAGIDAGFDGGVTPDAGIDAGFDGGVTPDAGIDAGFDGGVTPDAGIDAGFDGGVTPDAGIDAGFDGGVTPDAGIDAGVDAGVEPVDAGVTPDAGTELDAGAVEPPVDAGIQVLPRDAGVTRIVGPAATVEEFSPGLSRGCGCGVADGTGALAFALLTLLTRARRSLRYGRTPYERAASADPR